MAPLLFGVTETSITRSGATISWTTNLPASSQVDLGLALGQAAPSPLDPSLVTNHVVVLTGLASGSSYSFRARSVTANGGLGISEVGTFVTAPGGSGPVVTSMSVLNISSTTASLAWTTDTGTVAQVEYGISANYESSTLLKVFPLPAQQMVLTGLRPGTAYHYRVKTWDSGGNLAASADSSFKTALAGLATLIGEQAVYPGRVSLAAGQATAYQYTAAQSGQADAIRVYLDAGSTAAEVRVALYADQVGSPSTILAQGSAPGLNPGWANITIPPIPVAQGGRYWIAVLSPIGAGGVNLRSGANGSAGQLSRQTSLAAFPALWTAGALAAGAPLSAYVQQVPPAITLTGPAEGATVAGSVSLAAVVDDDVPIAQLQFYVDGLPVGTPLVSAPYSASWDSTGLAGGQPHSITARTYDTLGRSQLSNAVTVQVDNGPSISAVDVSPGLTTSSVQISWTTDTVSDSQIEFGPSIGYGLSTPTDPRTSRAHSMQLTGLAPGTTYHYRVRSHGATGAVGVSQDSTFSIAQP